MARFGKKTRREIIKAIKRLNEQGLSREAMVDQLNAQGVLRSNNEPWTKTRLNWFMNYWKLGPKLRRTRVRGPYKVKARTKTHEDADAVEIFSTPQEHDAVQILKVAAHLLSTRITPENKVSALKGLFS